MPILACADLKTFFLDHQSPSSYAQWALPMGIAHMPNAHCPYHMPILGCVGVKTLFTIITLHYHHDHQYRESEAGSSESLLTMFCTGIQTTCCFSCEEGGREG